MADLNAGIILSGQNPNILGAMAAGNQAAAQQNEYSRTNAFNNMLSQNGAGIMAGDPGAMNALAGYDPQAALGIQNTRQSMAFDKEKMGMLRQESAAKAAEHVRALSDQERAAEAAKIERAIAAGQAAQSPEQWDRLMQQFGAPEFVGRFADKDAIAFSMMGVVDAMKAAAPVKSNPTDDMREFEYAKSQGFAGTLQDWIIGQRKAGAASNTVNVGGTDARMGAIPQGYTAIKDPTSPAGYRMVAIPGGPEDSTASSAAAASNAATASDVVTTAAARAREAVGKQNFGPMGTEFVAGLPFVGAQTDSGEVMRQVDVLKSQAAAGNLQAMRDASKTGGALGNVTEKELKLLQDKSGALNPNSPNFLRDLDDYERTLLRTIHGNAAGDAIFEQTRRAAGKGSPPPSQAGPPSQVLPDDDALIQKYLGTGQ